MKIIRPLPEHLPSYIAALQQGWSPNSMRGADASREEIDTIDRDPQRYLELMADREAASGRFIEPFVKPAAYGGTPGLRYRIFFPSAEDAQRER